MYVTKYATKTACVPLNAKQANDKERSSRTASTAVIVVRKSDRRIGCLADDSVSSRPRSGWSISATAQHSRARQHRVTPAKRLCRQGAKIAGQQNACRDRALGNGEGKWRVAHDGPAPQQLGTGRGCNRGNAVANQGRQNEADGTTEDCHCQTGACKQQGDLAHANGAVPDDETARSQLADQPGKCSQREID